MSGRNEFRRNFVKRIRADVLSVGPGDGAPFNANTLKVDDVAEFMKHAEIEQVAAVVDSNLSIGKRDA